MKHESFVSDINSVSDRERSREYIMIHHVWGLMAHPHREWKYIEGEHESATHMYASHVLLLATIPVVSAFVGTTTVGWDFGRSAIVTLSTTSALQLAVLFYLTILGAIALMGFVIHRMAQRYTVHPDLNRCIVFAGYVATPMFLAGLVALYPMIWLCVVAGVVGLCYTGYLLYLGLPGFLGIDRKEGFIVSSSTLGIGVLVLEVLLAIAVLLWGYGSHLVY